jgi:hypothetical protein
MLNMYATQHMVSVNLPNVATVRACLGLSYDDTT